MMRRTALPLAFVLGLLAVATSWAGEVRVYTNREIKPVVLQLIGQARQSLDIQMYTLTDQEVIRALQAARQRGGVAVRIKTPKILHLETTRQPTDHARFLKLLGYVAKGIHAGLFYPNPNFTCPSCPYRKHCDAWQKV